MKEFKLFDFQLFNKLKLRSGIKLSKPIIATIGIFLDLKSGFGLILFGIELSIEWKIEYKK